MRVLLTGSSGFIGKAVAAALGARGDEVHRVVRRRPAPGEVGIEVDARRLDASEIEGGSLEGVDAAIHLGGAPIVGRWTVRRLEEIRASRVATGDIVARALAGLDRKPAVLVSGSAVGYYGDRGDEELDEQSASGTGVLADLCRAWESSASPAAEAGIRVVVVRTGIVLGNGGILSAQLPLFKLGLGARLGDGRQWTSWISLEDEVAIWLRALDDAALSGPVNATAPNPVRNRELTDAIAGALGRRARLAVPRAVLELGLGSGPADEMLLASQRALPRRMLAAGFPFAHEHLDGAIRAALAT